MLLTISDRINSVAQFLTVLLIFLFVLFITWFTTRYIAGYQKSRMITGNMELKETLRISNNKYLQIVRAGDKYLVMAVCKDTVTMLTELTEDELDFTAAPVEAGMDFKGIMEKARQRYSDSKKQDSDKDSGR